jgi:hypothetical protein
MSAQHLSLTFAHSTLSPRHLLNAVRSLISTNALKPDTYLLNRKPVDITDPSLRVSSPSCRIKGGGMEMNFISMSDPNLDIVTIVDSEGPLDWQKWEVELIRGSNLIAGWILDSEYDYWQNAEDPMSYEAADRPYEGLPMKSNGLPHPVERQVIDTSCNPGRWRHRDRYIEAVASTMWLGECFWEGTGADRKRVATARWLRVSELDDSIMRIQAADVCFTTAEGDSGKLQGKLRDLLYPNHRREEGRSA